MRPKIKFQFALKDNSAYISFHYEKNEIIFSSIIFMFVKYSHEKIFPFG